MSAAVRSAPHSAHAGTCIHSCTGLCAILQATRGGVGCCVMAPALLPYGRGCHATLERRRHGSTACEYRHRLRPLALQELNEAGLLRTPERPEPRNPTAEDLPKLRLLNAIFHESLRFFPPAAGASARQLDRELTIGGYRLPAGTAIAVPVWGLHRCRKYWGEDAKEWRPARWLEERSVNAAKKGPAGGVRWLPFSDGPQNCIGQHIATVRLAQRRTARIPEGDVRACASVSSDRMRHVHHFPDLCIHSCSTAEFESGVACCACAPAR